MSVYFCFHTGNLCDDGVFFVNRYLGLSPTFTSEKFTSPGSDGNGRMSLEDVTERGVGGPKKLWVGLGGLSTVVVTLCAVVVFKRVFDADPRDVF